MYNYEREKPYIFTTAGKQDFLIVRSVILDELKKKGSLTVWECLKLQGTCCVWTILAYIDFMAEKGDIEQSELTKGKDVMTQDRVLILRQNQTPALANNFICIN